MHQTTQSQELTRTAGIANSTFTGIERWKRHTGVATITKLAEVLNITNELLIMHWHHGMKPQD